jgi:membrane associated rhomboid family serine protease
VLTIACAESLPSGTGTGDFDAFLEIVSGPERVGERLFIGGVVEIPIGKIEGLTIRLMGDRVSRRHCRLGRVDFGPSRWSVTDDNSTNGLFVNGRRIAFKELVDGDIVRVGAYELMYSHVPVAALPVESGIPGVPAVAPGSGVPCPSCERELPAEAKICVACGIKLDTGRPVLLSADHDLEDFRDGATRQLIEILTWIIWLTPFPMPFRSEAFGRHKPWAIRGIAAVTILASVAFTMATWSKRYSWDVPGKNLELWPVLNKAQAPKLDIHLRPSYVKRLIQEMDDEDRQTFNEVREKLRGTVPDDQLDQRAVEEITGTLLVARVLGEPGEFQPHQLFTHARLHDNTSFWGFLEHLAGNLVFLLVFGSRINGLLGNVATLVLYPILAAGAAIAHLWLGHPEGPMLGCSGAVMGLAGMYLVLFPVHRAYCGMWIRFFPWCGLWIFALRGFWILLLYVGLDVLMLALHSESGTAHWAHVGGFLLGMTIALTLLLSRQVNCGGGDLLSVTLGKWAWPLIGRPAQWNPSRAAQAEMGAVAV